MPRQSLIEEIHRLKIEKKEDELNILNDLYIFQKYPHIGALFGQYKRSGERWQQLVRETIFAEVSSIRYMYDRTIQLIRRIGQNPRRYFEIKTEVGTYTLPDRLSNFNKLLELYQELFYDIIPGLTKKSMSNVLPKNKKASIFMD